MRSSLVILICLFPAAVLGQIAYPFNSEKNNDDLLAYWYNVPKDSVHLKIMDLTFQFYSTLEVYGKSSDDSFVLDVEAWQGSNKLLDKQFVVENKKADKNCRLSFNDDFFKLVFPVEYVKTKPDRIMLTISDHSSRRSKEIICTYHKFHGRVCDFEGNSFPAFISVRPDDFNFSTSIWSDSLGYYEIELPERTYNDIAVVNENYGVDVAEAWAWHIAMDADQQMDFKIGTGEVYNLNVWPNNGGGDTYFVSFRPMSLHLFQQAESQQAVKIGGRNFNLANGISLKMEDLKLTINGKESRIISMQEYFETHNNENASSAYLLQVDKKGFSKAGKQNICLEFNAHGIVNGKEIIHNAQGYFQFYTNYAGLSSYY